MTSIHSDVESQAVFDPEALRVMSQAFHDACNALHIFAGDAREREVIATRIIDLASTGVVDAAALRDRVMREAGTQA